MPETTAEIPSHLKTLTGILPICIAALALIVSLSQLLLARRSNEMAHRPYVVALPYTYPKEGRVVAEPQSLMIMAYNSPARVTLQDDSVIVRDSGGSRVTLLNRVTLSSPYIVVPSAQQQSSSTIAMDFEQAAKRLNPGETLVRSVVVKYEWVSGPPKYQFEATWCYEPNGNQWRPVNNSGS